MKTTGTVTEREQWERERMLESLEAFRAGVADAPFVRKYAINLGGLPNPDRPLTFVASDEAEDRLGDVVRTEGWDLSAYVRNPVFLWAHDHTRTPIGRSSWIGVDDARLLATVEFAPTPFAREVETLYRQRFLRAVSVGFRPIAFALRQGPDGGVRGVEFTKQELLEISAVAVPANPRALANALDGGLNVPRLRSLFCFTGARAGHSPENGTNEQAAQDRAAEGPPDGTKEVQADAIVAALRGLRDALAG